MALCCRFRTAVIVYAVQEGQGGVIAAAVHLFFGLSQQAGIDLRRNVIGSGQATIQFLSHGVMASRKSSICLGQNTGIHFVCTVFIASFGKQGVLLLSRRIIFGGHQGFSPLIVGLLGLRCTVLIIPQSFKVLSSLFIMADSHFLNGLAVPAGVCLFRSIAVGTKLRIIAFCLGKLALCL